MEIVWYGHACFRLRGRGCAAVTDPFSPELGRKLPSFRASVVTISHAHEGHNYARAVRGRPYVISGPGEYEVNGIFVWGIPTYHDGKKGQERGKNTAYVLEIEGLSICHLGDLGHIPSQEQIEAMDGIDVLLVPVGGRHVLDSAAAAETVNLLEPSIVIPMHYPVPGLKTKGDPVDRFLKEMAVGSLEPLEKLSITKSGLSEQTRVVLLDPRQ